MAIIELESLTNCKCRVMRLIDRTALQYLTRLNTEEATVTGRKR